MALHNLDGLKIITHHEFPPIPLRGFDWVATLDGYEPGDAIGYGPTEAAAIEDLTDARGLMKDDKAVEIAA